LSLKSDIAMLMARRGEKDYLLRYKTLGFEEARTKYVTQVQDQVAIIHQNLTEMKSLETHEDDLAIQEAMDEAITEYEATFLATVVLIEQRGHVDTGLEGQFRQKVHDIEAFVEAQALDQLTIDMLAIRRTEKDYLLRGQDKYVTGMSEAVDQFKTDVAATDLTQTEKTQLTTLANDYQTLFNQLVEIDVQIADSIETYRDAVHTVEPLLDEVLAFAKEGQIAARDNMERTAQTATLTVIGVSVSVVVIGLLVAFFLSRNIADAVAVVVRAAEGIAEGDLEQFVEVTSKDELGNMAAAFQRMIAYMQEMASLADQIAQGNLTVNAAPKSNKDALGNAFSQMITNLRTLVGDVQRNASQVASASAQLNSAADQAGQASQQVSRTIQQVAAGTNQQTKSVTEATGNVEQMARASEGIARGAQEQATAVQKTSDLIGEMAGIVSQVNTVTESVTVANAKVTQAAENGSNAVEETVQGMENIRLRTADAAKKVREMDERSKEISRIVEMIDDIADKTDMLALNAAVEAARAGEHGRGFAVVADQVRKLSEDSKVATRDIDRLIARVQETINEAIAAMDSTGAEVDNGSRLAGDTTRSLGEIMQAAEEAAELSSQINVSATQLKQKNEGVVAASESVGAVVEENTAVAEEMATNSQEVSSAMEGVAGISEENSAAAEEVSANAEEMTAQIEEVVASAEELSSLAEELHAAIAQFNVEDEGWGERAVSGSANGHPQPVVAGYAGNGRSA
jgi:methyl-accepting chemotaxis protein